MPSILGRALYTKVRTEKPKFQSRTVGLQCFVRYGVLLARAEDSAVLYHQFVLTHFQFLAIIEMYNHCERLDGLMVALVSRSSGPVSSPAGGHCVVFLGKTL